MRLAATVVCACLTLASSLHAQSPGDSTEPAFHAGEWGVQAVAIYGLSEAGALRFATPTRAWVLDGAGSFQRHTDSGNQGSPGTDLLAGVTASFGSRWYHAPARLVRFSGVGIVGGYTYAHYGRYSQRTDLWSAGAYGEVGAVYMFTPHVGVGSRALVTFTRAQTDMTTTGAATGGSERVVDYRVVFYPVQLLATIYF